MLLLLRTLAIAALLLAFLQPLLMSQFAAAGGPARTVVLVVDESASMGFADGTRTRPAQATAAAEEVLATLPAGSKANIVWIRARTVSALPEPGPNLEFLRQELLVARWDGRHGDALRKRLESGGIVVVQPGPGIRREALSVLAGTEEGSNAAPTSTLDPQEREAPGWRLRIAQEEYPVFSLFAGGLYGDPAGAIVRKRVASPVLPAGAQVLLAYDDGTPALALIEPPNSGLLAIWNVDLGATNWPDQGVFVPCGRLARGRTRPRRGDPGFARRLAGTRDRFAGAARKLSLDGAGNGACSAIMNFPEPESDLRQLPLETLQASGGGLVAGSGSNRIAELREGTPLWPWCLAVSAIFLLLEGVVLWRLPERWAAQPPARKREAAAVS